MPAEPRDGPVKDYLGLGLALGRHLEGLVDCYYGPAHLADEASRRPLVPPDELVERCRRLLAELATDCDLGADRRRWLEAQARGLHTTARRLAGEEIPYEDEVEACYGVRPRPAPEDDFRSAHARLDAALPGSGDIRDRYITWREGQEVPRDRLEAALASLAEDFRARTKAAFGLPEGETVEFTLVTNKPWGGFNYYLGGLKSRVAINVDLPVLSTGLGALVAHEAYPGHHTEHCRKEVGLVRRRGELEETLFLVGTPQCLIAEGLADLGLEIIAGRHPETLLAEHLRPLGIPYDADLVAEAGDATEALASVRGNAALQLHARNRPPEEVVDYVARWGLMSRPRAKKVVEFVADPTWRAYVFCYIEGLRLCRSFCAGDPSRFARLISERLVPEDLAPPTPE